MGAAHRSITPLPSVAPIICSHRCFIFSWSHDVGSCCRVISRPDSMTRKYDPKILFCVDGVQRWEIAMGDSDGRRTPLPSLSPMQISQKSTKCVDRRWRSSPLSVLSEYSRPVVVCLLKRPNDGQRRVPLRSGVSPLFMTHGGNTGAGHPGKAPKGQKRPHRRALRATNPFKTRV